MRGEVSCCLNIVPAEDEGRQWFERFTTLCIVLCIANSYANQTEPTSRNVTLLQFPLLLHHLIVVKV